MNTSSHQSTFYQNPDQIQHLGADAMRSYNNNMFIMKVIADAQLIILVFVQRNTGYVVRTVYLANWNCAYTSLIDCDLLLFYWSRPGMGIEINRFLWYLYVKIKWLGLIHKYTTIKSGEQCKSHFSYLGISLIARSLLLVLTSCLPITQGLAHHVTSSLRESIITHRSPQVVVQHFDTPRGRVASIHQSKF